MKQLLTVTSEDGVVRIDVLLAQRFPQYSRAALRKLFDLKLIKRNGIEVRPGEKIRPAQSVEIDLGPLQQEPEVIPLPIIFEDSDVVVVDKPAGIISHARGRFWQEASVASFIRSRVVEAMKQAEQETDTQGVVRAQRAGIVHRLDRATSGVMICAKNPEAMRYLQRQFHDREVQKTYIAVVSGKLEHETAIIDAAIARNPHDPKRFFVDASGKHAETAYTVLQSNDHHSLVELTPKTGRTHQLRVHLNYIGHPIVGDELYGGETAARLMLHAYSLTIQIPSGEQKTFISSIPKELSDLC